MAVLLLICGTGAAATDAYGAEPDHSRQVAWFVEQLRKSPVYISDQIPRSTPRSAGPAFVKEAKRTGVPTYLLVVPSDIEIDVDVDDLLSAVHRRLGRKGLYVTIDGNLPSEITAHAYGVDTPALHDAKKTIELETPDDATPLDVFSRFANIVGMSPDDAGDELSYAKSDTNSGRDTPDGFYTTHGDRTGQNIACGVLLTATSPIVLLLILRRRPRKRPRDWAWPLAGAAVSLLLVYASTDKLFTTHRIPPKMLASHRDLQARADRIADGLKGDDLYSDPESLPLLTDAETTSVRKRFAALDRPVRIALLPNSNDDDESSPHNPGLLQRIHHAVGKPGIYVAVMGDTKALEVANYGQKLNDDKFYDAAERVRFGSTRDAADLDESGRDRGLKKRLMKLADVIDRTPPGHGGKPGTLIDVPPPPPQSTTLQPLRTGQPFYIGLTAGVVTALIAWAVGADGVRRRWN